jgi:hypothetical protein
MAVTFTRAVDSATGAASLQLFRDGVLKTTYTLSAGTFNLSARLDDDTLNRVEANVLADAITAWYDSITEFDVALPYAWADCLFRITDESGKWKVRLELDSAPAIQATIDKGDRSVKYLGRPALVLSPWQFKRFVYGLTVCAKQTDPMFVM